MASFPMFMPFQMPFPAVVSNHTGNNACLVLVLPSDLASLPRPDLLSMFTRLTTLRKGYPSGFQPVGSNPQKNIRKH